MIEEIFVVAKTYPTRSRKYKELVCTAGINRKGKWIRIYPITYRTMEEFRKFERYTWIRAEVIPDKSDPRAESHKINISSIELLEHVPTNKNWYHRKDLITKDTKVYTNLEEIIYLANVKNTLSLCTFKPAKCLEVQKNTKEKPTKEEELEFQNANKSLFDNELCKTEFKGMPHIPYKFKIKFEDDSGKRSTMSVIDWEYLQLFLKYKNPETGAEKVKEKILSHFEKDIHLFLGTMRQMHGWTSNPYTIIGIFYPPKNSRHQGSLF